MTMVSVPVIRTEEDLQWATDRIAELWGAPAGSPEGDELDALMVLVEAYEKEHYPMDPPTPVEVVKGLMDRLGLNQQDLVPIFGSSGKVSEFLNGKRELSKTQIARLHVTYGIPLRRLLPVERPAHKNDGREYLA